MTSAADSSARRERLFQARDTAGRGGRGYSRFVRSLRLALPLLAGALLILTTIWPNVDWWNAIVPDGLNVTIDPRDAQQLRMDNARLVGSDENGQPFELSATEARQGPDGVDSIILQAPAGKIELKDGVHLKMQANEGQYDRKAEKLELTGAVIVEHGGGYRFQSESATVDLERGRAIGHQPIKGYGPEGQLEGEGFEIIDKGRTVLIHGKSRLLVTKVPKQP